MPDADERFLGYCWIINQISELLVCSEDTLDVTLGVAAQD